MKIYIISAATYSEDGDLSSWAEAYGTLEEAKKQLRLNYESQRYGYAGYTLEEINAMSEEDREGNLYPDEDASIGEDGMSWGSSGPNQINEEIYVQEIVACTFA